MDTADWVDDNFYQTGCFFPLKNEGKVILAKGGDWKRTPSTGEIQLQTREFYHQEQSYYHPEETIVVSLDDLKLALPKAKATFQLSQEQRYQEIFSEDFQRFKSSDPDLKKAVLMSRLEYKVDAPYSLKKYAFLQSLWSPIGEPYGFWDSQYAIIGCTPEILFEREENSIKSFALAGTALLANGQELMQSEKNRHEHNLVIKNIMEDLGPYCLELHRFNTHIAHYGKLVHLKTLIEGTLKEHSNTDDIICAMSPTAALGGYPRIKAKDFLLQTEYYKKFPKRFHGSAFTAKYGNSERSLVMIRNIQLQDEKLILEAGAGVVEASDQSSELNEIYQKLNAIRDVLL